MFPVKDIVIHGVRSVYYDSGPSSNNEAVVFVHGNPGPMDSWETLTPRVTSFARVIAMDLPGFGRAEHPYEFDFSVAGYARYLGNLLDQLELHKVHLVMHDFGAPFALEWARAQPSSRVASLTLINSGILRGYRWHRYARMWQKPLLGELVQLCATPRMIRKGLNWRNPKPLPREFCDEVARYADWAHKRAVLKLYRASRDLEALIERGLRECAGTMPPTCVIWGEQDPYIPPHYAHAQREFFPRAEINLLPGLGHWPFVDDAALVGDILTHFLQRQLQEPVAAQ